MNKKGNIWGMDSWLIISQQIMALLGARYLWLKLINKMT
jgi:hypothetical protein